MPPADPSLWQRLPVYDPATPLQFNSGEFLALFLGFYAAYLLIRDRIGARIAWLLAFSWFFYYKTSGVYLLALIVNVWAMWWIAPRARNARTTAGRRAWLGLGILIGLGPLGWYKYANFFLAQVDAVRGTTRDPLDIFLPIGISFYTFQSLAYLLDVAWKRIEPAKSLLDVQLFIAFFPQLVAGPIVRAQELLPQLRKPVALDAATQGRAIRLMAGGLFKKAVIADYLAANFVDRVFDDPGLYGGLETLLAVYGYALQIYGDFSGYSDIAIGLGLLMGFEFPANFNAPYRAASITEFWRRWHMTLSSWLRDYLYIPLGGNRLGTLRTYVNLMVTMLLGGLWHGAAWRFVAWGGLHGAALCGERWIRDRWTIPSSRWLRAAGVLLTFHLVCLGWIFFRARTFGDGMTMLHRIAGGVPLDRLGEFQAGYPMILPLLGIGFLLHALPRPMEARADALLARAPVPVQAACLAAVAFLAVQVASATIQPYIYFQF